ncbi:response regulator [Aminipila butyrica]|uniref:Stage 0 sporulation protein A homolog n=1 Tax=Aminipila butyrica TaxID=433296 RepID=A0A858BW62_9FIRM|nr:ATP-binding protein [Aminipila butyrica]QIB69338.1 response regulator [Aminipila butyrica]
MKTSVRTIAVLLCIFIIGVLFTSDLFFIKESPAALKGQLDLSAWDFQQDGLANLDGEWEYYENQLLTPEDFHNTKDGKPKKTGYINLTASRFEKDQGMQAKPMGAQTYRMIVKMKASEEPLGLKIDNIRMSNKLYINGLFKGSSGNPSKSQEEYIPKNAPYNAYFDVMEGQIEIVLQTANYNYPFPSDNSYTIILGTQKHIEAQKSMISAVELSGAILALFFGIYLLYVCYTSEKNKGDLYWAFQFFTFAVLMLFTGQKLIYGFFPSIPFELFCKIQLFSLMGGPFFSISYIKYREKKMIPDLVMKIVRVLFLLYALVVLVANYRYSSYFNGVIYLFICLIYLYLIFKLWRAYRAASSDAIQKKEILLYLLCNICLLLTFSDNFLRNLTWSSSRIIGSIGFCGFVFFSQITLAFQLSSSYEKVVKMDRVKDEFMIKTSYALKAPLNSILNMAEQIIRECSGEKELNTSYSQAKSLENAFFTRGIMQKSLNIVNTSQDLALLNNNQLKLESSLVDIKVCAELAVASMQELTKNKEINLLVELPSFLFVQADESRIRQILCSLILNSLQNMDRGTIRIRGRYVKNKVLIYVEDDGMGIPENRWGDIFQPYVTLTAEGIGLGLYVSRRLAELMQGRLYVEWSKPNEGSCFALILPRAEVEKKKLPTLIPQKKLQKEKKSYTAEHNSELLSLAEVQKWETKKRTVLIVDDENVNIQTAMSILEQDNYHILMALSGEEALQIIAAYKIDLVILDDMMPGISGIALCKKIRENYSLIELPIVLSVINMNKDDLNWALQSGANDFIKKPFRNSELRARVKTLIELKKSLDETLKNELSFLQAQIKPHFLYNAINTIIYFCYTDSEKAATLLSDFSKYLRMIFHVDQRFLLISLKRELELIEAYVAIEKARFEDKIQMVYNIDPELLQAEIPPLCIQPLVENAIKHGLLQKSEGGTVRLTVEKRAGDIYIEVMDDGIGMTKEKLYALQYGEGENQGIGFSNINQRLKRWSQAQIQIESQRERGTTVTIIMKQNMGELSKHVESDYHR